METDGQRKRIEKRVELIKMSADNENMSLLRFLWEYQVKIPFINDAILMELFYYIVVGNCINNPKLF